MGLGELVTIADATTLVLGQDIEVAKGKPDVATSLLHKSGDTLVVVDTGATAEFRAAVGEAARRLAPWSKILLLTTHGHFDHVGNNDLVDELGASAAATDVIHLVPAHDAAQLVNPADYWAATLRQLAGVVDGFDDTNAMVDLVVAMFEPQHPVGATTRTYETIPLEHLGVGGLHLSGWNLCDGRVQVIRTQGHCAGQVVVHLPEVGVLHLSDEPNGPCAAMHDSDQVKMLSAIGAALTLVESGTVALVTEGHSFEVHERADATRRLTQLLDQSAALDAAMQKLIAEPVGSKAVVSGFQAEQARVEGPGSPIFTATAALAKLRDLGLVSAGDGDAQRWTRPPLR